MAEAWRTIEELQAAKRAMIEALPDWELPVAYAMGVLGKDGQIDFRVTNYRGSHELPAVVLATVLGYRRGSSSYELDLATFERAISQLEPAGACDAYEHPNLWAWQRLRADLANGAIPAGSTVIAVFIGRESDRATSDPVRQLRLYSGIDPS